MDNTWNVAEYCKEDVDEEILSNTTLKKNTKRRNEDSKDQHKDAEWSNNNSHDV